MIGNRFRIIAFTLLLIISFQSSGEVVAAQKRGAKCTKIGVVLGSLTCTKSNGKLTWLPSPKKPDVIEFSKPAAIYLEDGNSLLDVKAKSGNPVELTSMSPQICRAFGSVIAPLSTGKCVLLLTTKENKVYLQAKLQEVVEVRRKNILIFSPQSEYLLSSSKIYLPEFSSAGLKISYLSQSADVCIVRGNVVELKSIGFCNLSASQNGDAFTDGISTTLLNLKIVRENIITFAPLQELALKLKIVKLQGISSSGLPVTYKSLTPDVCAAAENDLSLLKVGICSVVAFQTGDTFTKPATEISVNIDVVGQRITEDQPDSLLGFQIKPIYVIPSDGVDHQYDINGYIASALAEGNATLKAGIGYEFQIDSVGPDYDIQFFKSSFTKDYLEKSTSAGTELMKEMKIADKFGDNRKDYVFFIDIDSFKYETSCGYAGMPGMYAVVAVGPGKGSGTKCVGQSLQLKNYVSHTWVHEVFHNLGVEHSSNDPCDLMRGSSSSYCQTSWTIDKDRNRYVGSDKQGVNVLSLRVWKGYLNDSKLRASCDLIYSSVPRSDGLRYAVCPTGTQVIGALTYCWNSIRSVELQVWKNGAWSSLGDGNHFNEPWGSNVSWKCNNPGYTAPWKQLTVSTPGIQKYRWMVNGSESEQFNVIWQE